MFEGSLFTSGDDGLDPFVAKLDAHIIASFPEFFNTAAASRISLRADELTGRAVAVSSSRTAVTSFPRTRSWLSTSGGCQPGGA